MATLTLHPGKEKSVLRRHPWMFSGAVAQLEGRARPGDTVDVVSAEGRPLARAAWSPASQIRARIWSFDAGRSHRPRLLQASRRRRRGGARRCRNWPGSRACA
jgi:23S rRNA G2069 N7-methylase RlmK/C1962 C5-methylase RlmI